MTPLDNQELDKLDEILHRYFAKKIIQAGNDHNYMMGCIKAAHDEVEQIILSEAHRIGNLAIGEDYTKNAYEVIQSVGDVATYLKMVTDDDLRKEQRQKLKELTGIKHED